MSRNEDFFCTEKLRTKEDSDLILNFKREVSRYGDSMSSRAAAECYADLVAQFFGLESIKGELEKCFFKFHRNEWSRGVYLRYHIGSLVEILGRRRYQRVAKIFKESKIKKQLEEAGFKRVGLLTFINMVNYVIHTLMYKRN